MLKWLKEISLAAAMEEEGEQNQSVDGVGLSYRQVGKGLEREQTWVNENEKCKFKMHSFDWRESQ